MGGRRRFIPGRGQHWDPGVWGWDEPRCDRLDEVGEPSSNPRTDPGVRNRDSELPARTPVRSEPEGQRLTQVAFRVEPVRITKHGRVAIGGGQQQECGARLDRLPGDRHRRCDEAPGVLHRGVVAGSLVNDPSQPDGVGRDLGQQVGLASEGRERVGNQPGRRIQTLEPGSPGASHAR